MKHGEYYEDDDDGELNSAIASGKPVVALESTIIAHGMPFPQNLEMAREVGASGNPKDFEKAFERVTAKPQTKAAK